MPEQETHLLERRSPREVVDVVSVIRQHAAIAVEIADRGRRGDDVFEAALWFRFRTHATRIISGGGLSAGALAKAEDQRPGARTNPTGLRGGGGACTRSRRSCRRWRTRRCSRRAARRRVPATSATPCIRR